MKIFGFMIPFYYLIYFMDFIYINILIIFLFSILKDKTDTRFTKKNHFNPVSIYNSPSHK